MQQSVTVVLEEAVKRSEITELICYDNQHNDSNVAIAS